jgi:hypothetical protein
MKERRQKRVGVGDAFVIRRAKERKAACEGLGRRPGNATKRWLWQQLLSMTLTLPARLKSRDYFKLSTLKTDLRFQDGNDPRRKAWRFYFMEFLTSG